MPTKEDGLLTERRQALEEEFFRRQEQEQIAKLRQQREREELRQALTEVSGITDVQVLDRLIDLGIQPRTLAPLALVPLVVVAWADGTLDAREREAIEQAAAACGVGRGSAGYALLETWLEEKPDPALLRLWKEYVQSWSRAVDPAVWAQFRDDILQRARAVAEAAGGFLGLGRKVSAAEAAVLRELADAFEVPPAHGRS